MENIKQSLFHQCQAWLERRILNSKQAIESAQEASNNETKSSSGDKYETGRAMMQLEIEKDSLQLSESLKLKRALDQINLDLKSIKVHGGSLVKTNHGVFFIAISVGQLEHDGKTYLVISPASPIGLKLMGLMVNDSFAFNGRNYVVEEIR